jgi:hypothetical protein
MSNSMKENDVSKDLGIRRCAAGLVLVLCGWVGGQEALAENLSYTYIDAEYLRVDLDIDESTTIGTDLLAFETDDDRGYRVAASWELFFNFHLFGEFQKAENDYKTSLTGPAVDTQDAGDFDVTRWRAGVGYGLPLGDRLSVYGRVTYDNIDVESIRIDTITLGDDDDNGVGFEGGLRWLVLQTLELQAYGRYSDVGSMEVGEGFDDDVLGGVQVRWNAFGSEDLAYQMGYEFGDINTLNIGVRFIF